jgi:hypothetical protein
MIWHYLLNKAKMCYSTFFTLFQGTKHTQKSWTTASVMRTSPRWTHRHYGLPQVAIRPQLSCHVTLGFSRHVVTVLVITLIRHQNGAFLDALERGRQRRRFGSGPSSIRSVDPFYVTTSRCCVTYLGQLGHVSCRALSPSCGRPTPGRSQP